MRLTSTAFESGKPIPDKYTCKGADTIPELSWDDVPDETKSFALIMDDPDAPQGTFTHWIVYNIPADQSSIDEYSHLPGEGKNDFGRVGYGGPCPPRGHGSHRYHFRLYALDIQPDLPQGADRESVENSIKDHILAVAELAGAYEIKS